MTLLAAFNPSQDTIPFRFGAFTHKDPVWRQEVGRIDIIDEDKNVVKVHAIRLHPSSILGMILTISLIGRVLSRIVYGSYSYKNIHGEDFLVSDMSYQKSMVELKKLRDLAEAQKVRFGLYKQSQVRFGLGIGRLEAATDAGALSDVHAIQLSKGSILGSWLTPGFVGGLITKTFFGDYSLRNVDGQDFLVSNRSLEASKLQQKAIAQIDALKRTEHYTGKIAAKVDCLREKLVVNKSPFSNLVNGSAKAYHELNNFALFVHGKALEVMVSLNPFGEGGSKEVFKSFNITKMKDQVLLGFKEVSFITWFLRAIVFRLSAATEFSVYQELKQGGVRRIAGMDEFTLDTSGNFVALMELCNGGGLQDKVSSMTDKQKVLTLAQVAESLAEMHEAGYVHRDIKLDNVLMHNSEPRLADFGCALKAGTYTLPLGTPGYVPQDISESDFPLSAATPTQDLWAFGIMIKEAFGKDFDRQNAILHALVNELMQLKPERRMSARNVAAILNAVHAGMAE